MNYLHLNIFHVFGSVLLFTFINLNWRIKSKMKRKDNMQKLINGLTIYKYIEDYSMQHSFCR